MVELPVTVPKMGLKKRSMKTALLLILMGFFCLTAIAGHLPDSVLSQYAASRGSSQKGKLLLNYVRRNMPGTATERISVLLQQLDDFDDDDDFVGKNYINVGIGIVSWRSGEFAIATKYITPALQYFEKEKDSLGILRSLDALGSTYVNAENYEQGLSYWRRALPMARSYREMEIYSAILNNIADCYLRLKSADSALYYIQEAVRIGMDRKDTSSLSFAVGTMGEVYMLRDEHEIARPFLKRSIRYSLQENDRFGAAYSMVSMAESFFATGDLDSSIYYARQGLAFAEPDYKKIMLQSYESLYHNFEKKEQQDSIFKYFRLAMMTKDSLFTMEKNRSLQSANFQEEVRLREQEAAEEEAAEIRQQNIQYVLIALSIISLFMIYLLLSRSFITNTKVIEYFGVVALLIVFEFLNLLLHPFLEKITNHSPVLMLIALVCIAALLVPFHHKIEKWATQKLVEKNKKIRLAAAKKTIESIEGVRQ